MEIMIWIIIIMTIIIVLTIINIIIIIVINVIIIIYIMNYKRCLVKKWSSTLQLVILSVKLIKT